MPLSSMCFRNSYPALQDRAVAGKWPPMSQISELVTRGRTMFETFVEAADAQLGQHALIAFDRRSEAHTSELQSLMRISYAAFCLTKKQTIRTTNTHTAYTSTHTY